MDNYKLKCNFIIYKTYFDIFHNIIFINEEVLVDNNKYNKFLHKKSEMLTLYFLNVLSRPADSFETKIRKSRCA